MSQPVIFIFFFPFARLSEDKLLGGIVSVTDSLLPIRVQVTSHQVMLWHMSMKTT